MTERNGPAPINVSVEQAAEAFGVGRTEMFKLIKSGEVPSFKQGKRRLVPLAGLRAAAHKKAGLQDLEAEQARDGNN